MIDIDIEGIKVSQADNGLKIESCSDPFYIFGNITGYDFKSNHSFYNHYLNDPINKQVKVERNGIAVIASVEYFNEKFFVNISAILDTKLDNMALLYAYNAILQTISTTQWDENAIATSKIDNELGNFYNIVFVACRGEPEKVIPFDISLFYELKEITQEAISLSLKQIGYPKDITHFLNLKGRTVDDMCNVASVIDSSIDIDKFKDILLDALDDSNVIQLIDGALCIDEDISRSRIRSIDKKAGVMNETIGLILARYIAGGDLKFSFNEYQNIDQLSNITSKTSDVILGLIIGCLSRDLI